MWDKVKVGKEVGDYHYIQQSPTRGIQISEERIWENKGLDM